MNILEFLKKKLLKIRPEAYGPTLCVETRYGRFQYGAGAKIPGNMVAESNEYRSEQYLLDYLKKAGLRAKYELDDERYPKILHIVCPSMGKDFYPKKGKDLTFTIRPATNKSGNAVLSIDFEIEKDEKEDS